MLCTKYEGDLQERPVWAARITNGIENITVYQNDHDSSNSSWIELKDYCENYGYKIHNFHLRFRTEVVDIDITQGDALYFAKGIAMLLGNAANYHFYSVGIWKDGKANIKKYHLPDLSPFTNEQVREINENDPNLIKIAP